MAMPGLTNYNAKSPNVTCVECGDKILPWARSLYCATCRQPACRRHGPLFITDGANWNCTKCRNGQQQWAATASIVTQLLRTAETLYKTEISEAQTLADDIFYELMLPDKEQ